MANRAYRVNWIHWIQDIPSHYKNRYVNYTSTNTTKNDYK